MRGDFDLEELVHLEQTFYETGYEDGFAHGRIHGLIEGRALGRAKGFEMWEELGFYEGFAMMWMSIYEKQGRNDDRATTHTRRLLELIAKFPRVNPSASSSSSTATTDDSAPMDVAKLFRQIRSRYKALCSTLGVRPTLRYSEKSQDRDEVADEDGTRDSESRIGSSGVTGRSSVWRIDNSVASSRAAANDAF